MSLHKEQQRMAERDYPDDSFDTAPVAREIARLTRGGHDVDPPEGVVSRSLYDTPLFTQLAREEAAEARRARGAGTAPGAPTQPRARPADTDPCGRCTHAFGRHFKAYNGIDRGCSETGEVEHGDTGTYCLLACKCDAFTIAVRWED